MEKPGEMNTLVSVMEELNKRGYNEEFRMTKEGFADTTGKVYQPDQLKIIKIYRFEGDSNPSDSSVLYILESNDGIIGYSLDAFGMYEDNGEDYNNFMRQVPISEREDEMLFQL
jgi:hypothetical protein